MSLFSEIAHEFTKCIFLKNSNFAKIAFYLLFVIPIVILLITLWYIYQLLDPNYTYQKNRFLGDKYLIANKYVQIENVYINEYILTLFILWGLWFVLFFIINNVFQDSINMENVNTHFFLNILKVSFFTIIIVCIAFTGIDNTETANIAKHKIEFQNYVNDNLLDTSFVSKVKQNIPSGENIIQKISQMNKLEIERISSPPTAKTIATVLILKQMERNKYKIANIDDIQWVHTINANTKTLFETNFIKNLSQDTTIIDECEKLKRDTDLKIQNINLITSTTFSKQFWAIFTQSILFVILLTFLFYNQKKK